MTTPEAPLPKRQPLRTREELLQAGGQHAEGLRPASESAERLAALLMLAFPDKPGGTGPPDASASKDGPVPGLSLDSATCRPARARARRCDSPSLHWRASVRRSANGISRVANTRRKTG